MVVALTRSKCGRANARAEAGASGEGGVEFVHRRLEASDVCRLAARGAGRPPPLPGHVSSLPPVLTGHVSSLLPY